MPDKWPKDGPMGEHDEQAWKHVSNDMNAWGKDLEKWGKRVRRDIIALEQQRDFVANNPGLSPDEYGSEFRRIAEEAHNKVGLKEPYKGGDPEDPPPPPWKPK